ncbi:ABC transporter [Corynebacterium diphtheriae]|nr:ABC transporter [Corynebacterium diphtheriae]
MKRRALLTATAATAALCLNSCAQSVPPVELVDIPPLPLPAGATVGSPASGTIQTDNLLGSLRPNGDDVAQVRQRGYLIVGIDQSQNLLSFRDTDGELKGFEVDLAREVARDIFGEPKIDFRYVDSSSWVKALEDGQVDMVLRSISVTRERQDQVFFSTPYFSGKTRILTQKDSDIHGAADLKGTVCVTNLSTGSKRLGAIAPNSTMLAVRNSADCLLALQQNHADAVISDDAILSGMIAQDPFTHIVGEPLATEQYAVAFAKPRTGRDTAPMIRQVNSTFERIFRDGTWASTYNHWFGAYLAPQEHPAVHYREER